jgi:HEAT repeat protein
MKTLAAACFGLLLCMASAAAQGEKKTQPPDFDGMKALKHPDPDVRLSAAILLCDLGPVAKFAVPTVKEQLKEEKVTLIKVKLVEALWKIDKPPARDLLPVLLEALQDKDEAARAAAANVIGQFGANAKSAVGALSKALADKDLTVQAEAAMALGEIGPGAKAAVPALLATLKSDEAPKLLEPFVVGTLGKIGEPAVPQLKEALAAKEYRLKRGAAEALALMGKEAADAVEPLGKLLAAQEGDLRGVAARALGRIGPDAKATAATLVKLLDDSDLQVALNAAVALWQIDKSPAGEKVLLGALKHANPKHRELGCKACAELDGAKILPVGPLAACVKDPELRVRLLAEDALGRNGKAATEAAPVLRTALKDEDANVRVGAAAALWQIEKNAKEVVPLLSGWAVDRKNPTSARKAAVVALGEIGADARPVFDALVEVYRDDTDSLTVRRAIVYALRKIDAKAAVKAGVR